MKADVERGEVVDLLNRTLARIKDESRWCQDALARDADGHEVPPLSEDAASWCAFGAILRECDGYHADRRVSVGTRAMIEFERAAGSNMATANDIDGHAAVVDAYRKAIDAMRDDRSSE